ncbi:hypothetical protein [Bradyrhizobium sp.]|nr:hypothetical protein [Bradyrhizobium sp.]
MLEAPANHVFNRAALSDASIVSQLLLAKQGGVRYASPSQRIWSSI